MEKGGGDDVTVLALEEDVEEGVECGECGEDDLDTFPRLSLFRRSSSFVASHRD